MKMIAYEKSDRSVGVVSLSPQYVAGYIANYPRTIVEDTAIDRIAPDIIARTEGTKPPFTGKYLVINESSLPDYGAPDMWSIRGNRISVDIDKARIDLIDQLRSMRVQILLALDLLYMRADESNNAAEKASIAAKKQRLRDFPTNPKLVAAKAVNDLREITLEFLTGDDYTGL